MDVCKTKKVYFINRNPEQSGDRQNLIEITLQPKHVYAFLV